MPKIQFKTKIKRTCLIEGQEDKQRSFIQVPKIGTQHCDMHAFRSHKKYGPYANSNLFSAILQRDLTKILDHGRIYLDAIPECITVDTSSFLTVVTITIGE